MQAVTDEQTTTLDSNTVELNKQHFNKQRRLLGESEKITAKLLTCRFF